MRDLGDPATRIEDSESAIRRVEQLLARLEQLRNTMNIDVGDPATNKKIHIKAKQHWLMTYGMAAGVLVSFRGVKLIQRNPYRVLVRRLTEGLGREIHFALDRPREMTREQATTYVSRLCEKVVYFRNQCEVVIPDDAETTVTVQQDAYHRWNLYYGQAMGTLIAYRQASRMDDFGFDLCKAKIQATLAPSIVGTLQNPVKQPRGVRLV